MRSKAGFSLLEALAALTIAAVSLTALMGMQYQLVEAQRRAEAAIAKADLKKNALVLIREVNPDEQPEGEIALPPGQAVRWTATALTEPKLSAGFPNGDGRFMVTLYRLAVEVVDDRGTVLDAFEVERMGWTLGGVT
jgi:Tfp pilus assembly protein PilV